MKRSLGPRKRNWVSLPLWSSELPSTGPQTHTVLRLLEEFVILQCWGRVCCCVRRRLLLLASLSRAHAVGGLGARESILILWVEFRLGLSPAVVHYVPRVLTVLISNSELLSLKVDVGFIHVWTCSARLGSRAVAGSVNGGLGGRKTGEQKGRRRGHCCLLQDTPPSLAHCLLSLTLHSVHGIFWSCLLQCAKAGREEIQFTVLGEKNMHPDSSCRHQL